MLKSEMSKSSNINDINLQLNSIKAQHVNEDITNA